VDEEFLEMALRSETNFARLQKFLDAGYQGLYLLTEDQIRTRKGLQPDDFILDWMNSEELSANLQRIDFTAQRIKDEQIRGWQNINRVHFEVGRAIRQAIKQSGGILPEDQSTPEKSIQQVQREAQKQLEKGQQPSIFNILEEEP
jgi:DNA-damage-inducible protein D